MLRVAQGTLQKGSFPQTPFKKMKNKRHLVG